MHVATTTRALLNTQLSGGTGPAAPPAPGAHRPPSAPLGKVQNGMSSHGGPPRHPHSFAKRKQSCGTKPRGALLHEHRKPSPHAGAFGVEALRSSRAFSFLYPPPRGGERHRERGQEKGETREEPPANRGEARDEKRQLCEGSGCRQAGGLIHLESKSKLLLSRGAGRTSRSFRRLPEL